MSWNSLENALENLGTTDFDEIWLASSLYTLLLGKIDLHQKEDQRVEFHSKWEIWLISQ
jgi:hypothetical protein